MTATPARTKPDRLRPTDAETLAARLESGFANSLSVDGVLAHQHLLDALDRGWYERFVVWPPDDPVGVVYNAPTGTVIAAGDPLAGPALAPAADALGWRVLIGDAPVTDGIVAARGLGLFRRPARARQQRFMALHNVADVTIPEGLRRAEPGDLEAVTELACLLHVEDHMGPPLPRSGRAAVRERMRQSIARGATWVVERGQAVVGKADLALWSERRGAQIAGVYVHPTWRGAHLASGTVAVMARTLIEAGLPGVTLHVRADNVPAVAAYRRAGFTDRGAWTLALR